MSYIITDAIQILYTPPKHRTKDQLQKLTNSTKHVSFFKKITQETQSPNIHKKCCKFMTIQHFKPGANIVEYGQEGENFYIIFEGTCGLMVPIKRKVQIMEKVFDAPADPHSPRPSANQQPPNRIAKSDFYVERTVEMDELVEVGELKQGDSFGELALISNKPRAATVFCKSSVITGVLQKSVYNHILGEYNEKKLQQKIAFMQSLPPFANFGKNTLMKLSYFFKPLDISRGQKIYTQNQAIDNIYIIKSGEIKISYSYTQQQPKPKKLSHTPQPSIKPSPSNKNVTLTIVIKCRGEFFGHEEILDKQPYRQQSAECISNFSEVFYITKHDFQTRITDPECIRTLRERYSRDIRWRKTRIEQLKQVEVIKDQMHKIERVSTPQGGRRKKRKFKSLVISDILQELKESTNVLQYGMTAGRKTRPTSKSISFSRRSINVPQFTISTPHDPYYPSPPQSKSPKLRRRPPPNFHQHEPQITYYSTHFVKKIDPEDIKYSIYIPRAY